MPVEGCFPQVPTLPRNADAPALAMLPQNSGVAN
jgi:hypothetical protein